MPQILLPQMKRLVVLFYIAELYPLFFHASPEGRTGVSSYTGEGRHLGGIIGIPWPLLFYTKISIGIVHPTCPLVHH